MRTDREELLELRQENRKLKRQVQQMEGGKSANFILPFELAIVIFTFVCVALIISATAGWI